MIETLRKQGNISGLCVGVLVAPMSCPENTSIYRKSHHSQIQSEYICVVKQKSNLDNLEESRIDDLWNIDVKRIISESWSGSTRFRALNKRPLPELNPVTHRARQSSEFTPEIEGTDTVFLNGGTAMAQTQTEDLDLRIGRSIAFHL